MCCSPASIRVNISTTWLGCFHYMSPSVSYHAVCRGVRTLGRLGTRPTELLSLRLRRTPLVHPRCSRHRLPELCPVAVLVIAPQPIPSESVIIVSHWLARAGDMLGLSGPVSAPPSPPTHTQALAFPSTSTLSRAHSAPVPLGALSAYPGV